jgi:hypothetical protein
MANHSAVMLIPISMLWGTQLKLQRKIALTCIFSLVIITIIFAIVRSSAVNTNTGMMDTSWVYTWSAVETTIGRWHIILFALHK